MILLVDTGWRPGSLGRDEFVEPVARIVEGCGFSWKYIHYTRIAGWDGEGIRAVIICGTALKDNTFLQHPGCFSWLKETPLPVLGICAGMQILCTTFGGAVRDGCEIGMTDIHVTVPHPLLPPPPSFQAYELHCSCCDPPGGWPALASSNACIQAVRHPERPLFGVMFHPEVRNDRVIEKFLEMYCGKTEFSGLFPEPPGGLG